MHMNQKRIFDFKRYFQLKKLNCIVFFQTHDASGVSEIFGRRYWIRTNDLFHVKEAL